MNPLPSVQPVLAGPALTLRPFSPADAPAVSSLAGAREIAATTLTLPHPYEPHLAEEWIATHPGKYAAGRQVQFAVVENASGALVGAVGEFMDLEAYGILRAEWLQQERQAF